MNRVLGVWSAWLDRARALVAGDLREAGGDSIGRAANRYCSLVRRRLSSLGPQREVRISDPPELRFGPGAGPAQAQNREGASRSIETLRLGAGGRGGVGPFPPRPGGRQGRPRLPHAGAAITLIACDEGTGARRNFGATSVVASSRCSSLPVDSRVSHQKATNAVRRRQCPRHRHEFGAEHIGPSRLTLHQSGRTCRNVMLSAGRPLKSPRKQAKSTENPHGRAD